MRVHPPLSLVTTSSRPYSPSQKKVPILSSSPLLVGQGGRTQGLFSSFPLRSKIRTSIREQGKSESHPRTPPHLLFFPPPPSEIRTPGVSPVGGTHHMFTPFLLAQLERRRYYSLSCRRHFVDFFSIDGGSTFFSSSTNWTLRFGMRLAV